MKIIGIWAQTLNNVIGQIDSEGNYFIPWNFIKEDMNHFREITMNNVILMGYNTYKSIGKALPNRDNLVLTKSHYNELNVLFNDNGEPNDIHPVATFDEAVRIAKFLGKDKLIVIGGKQLYEDCILNHRFDIIYRTTVSKNLSIDNKTIVMSDNIKKYYKMTWCKKFRECNIETWELK